MDLKTIRTKSEKVVEKIGLPINPALPLLDVSESIRDEGGVFLRLMCLHVAAACAYGFDRAKAKDWISREILPENLANSELDFIYKGSGDSERFNIQIEGMWALSWALGLVPTLDFLKGCDNQFASLLPNLKIMQPCSLLRAKVRIRPLVEVVEACDVAYCLHWGIQQMQLVGEKLPSRITPYVVIERRRALDWLIGCDDWDEVTLDT